MVEPLDLGRQLAGAEAGADAAEAEARRAQTEVTIADDRAARVERAPELFSSEERSRAAAEREGARHALEVARARAAQATAEWQRLEEQWAHRLIRSPFEGFVAARFYDPGVVVGVGEPLLRLIRSDRYLLRFAVPPAEASGWQVGSCLTATIRDSHHDFSATVARIAPQVDPASQLVFAEADLEPETLAGESLQHGQVVDVRPCPGIGQK